MSIIKTDKGAGHSMLTFVSFAGGTLTTCFSPVDFCVRPGSSDETVFASDLTSANHKGTSPRDGSQTLLAWLFLNTTSSSWFFKEQTTVTINLTSAIGAQAKIQL